MVVRPEVKESAISEQGFTLRVREDPGLIGGACVWPAGRALAAAISDGIVSVKGLRVLELGCGLGLPSLAACRAGAESVTATDREELRELVEFNAKVNDCGNLKFAAFDWEEPENFKVPSVDLIIAADVIYYEEQDPLLNALRYCLARSSAEVVIAYRQRTELDRVFLESVILPQFQVTMRKLDDGVELYSLK